MGLINNLIKRNEEKKDFQRKYDIYNEINSNFKSLFRISEFINNYERLISQFDVLLETNTGKRIIKNSREDIINEIIYQIHKLYSDKVNTILYFNDKEPAKDLIIKLMDDIKKTETNNFKIIISEFIEDLNKVIEEFDIVFNNYQKQLELDDFNIIIENIKIYLNQQTDNKPTVEEYDDPLYNEAVEFVIATGKVSASLLQRKYRLGYNRAARIIDLLEERGIIGPQNGSKPREVLVKFDDGYDENKSSFKNTEVIINDGNILKQASEEVKIKITSVDELTHPESNDTKEKVKTFKLINSFSSSFGSNSEINEFKENKIEDSLKISERIKNSLVTNVEEDNEKLLLVDAFIKYTNPIATRIALIDFNRFNFIGYNTPNLLLPPITNMNKLTTFFEFIIRIIEDRYNTLSEKGFKNLVDYNNFILNNNIDKCYINQLKIIPNYIIIIDEMFEIMHNKYLLELLTKILMSGEKVGIKVISYSKMSKRGLNLNNIEDLLNISANYNFEKLLNEYDEDVKEENDIDDMNGFDFEKYSAELLKANGFTDVIVTQSSNDFGVDVIAYKDDIKYAIQCKKYASPVGIKAVQEVIGSKVMNDCHVAVVLTNNTFTKSAKELAQKNNVLLWDINKLEQLIANYEDKNI